MEARGGAAKDGSMRWLSPAIGCLWACAAACVHHHPDWGVGGFVRLADGSPLVGIQVHIEWVDDPGVERTETTNLDGHYQWDWDRGWGSAPLSVQDHVRVTPLASGYTFSPPSYEMHLPGMVHDLDFTATPTNSVGALDIWCLGYTVSGRDVEDVQMFLARGWWERASPEGQPSMPSRARSAGEATSATAPGGCSGQAQQHELVRVARLRRAHRLGESGRQWGR